MNQPSCNPDDRSNRHTMVSPGLGWQRWPSELYLGTFRVTVDGNLVDTDGVPASPVRRPGGTLDAAIGEAAGGLVLPGLAALSAPASTAIVRQAERRGQACLTRR
jgi:hypothetical protein